MASRVVDAVTRARTVADLFAGIGTLTFPIADRARVSAYDSDADGLTDTQEGWWCTDPLKVDSDGDGTSDGSEVAD